MGEPAEAVFINHVCYGALVGSLFDFFVWNEVTPLNDQNLSEAFFFWSKESSFFSWLVFRCRVSQPYRSVESIRQSSKIAATY